MSGGFRIGFRITLVAVIPLLVVVTGAGIALRTFFATRSTVQALATDLFREVTAETVAQTRSHLERAVPAIELAGLLTAKASGSEELARQFLEILRANPELSWVSYSDANGAFTGAYHGVDGALRINRSVIVNGKTALDEHEVGSDGKWTLRRHVDDSGYDPRTRPFYRLAADAKKRAWTAPYVFFDQGVPGITCAKPRFADGKLLGVYTVDFDLNALSQFVARLRLGEHGRVFVFAGDGTLIAHPGVRLVEKSGGKGEGRLVTLDDVDDPVARAFWKKTRAQLPVDGSPFEIKVDGANYYASSVPFAMEGLHWTVGAVAPEDDFMAGVQRNNLVSLAMSLGAVLAALLLALLLSSRIARPLERVAAQMEEVGHFRLDDSRPDESLFAEIALMNQSLTHMKRGLRSFASYVPRDLVRAVLASGQEAKLGGRLDELTVFFSDIAGFTSVAEGVTPEELVQMLGHYFEETTRVIGQSGGTVDKFIGDAIMAFWGAPTPEPMHATRACEAALGYQRRLRELRERGEPWALQLRARIGLASGPMVVGNIGSPERLNYTVMGDTVNLASRLEGLNKMYGTEILVAESTYTAAKCLARPVDVAAVKGKAQATRVYELLAPGQEWLAQLATDGLEAYLRRDFAAAEKAYSAILARLPDDGPAKLLLERVRHFAASPPPPDWTGVHVLHEK